MTDPKTQRWKLTIEYDGTPFMGWQKQKHGASVQQSLEHAIQKFSGQSIVKVQCAGRTDAGVHATGQVAHVDMEKDFEPKNMRDATNFHVGDAPISILKAEKVSDDFHARFGAKMRAYRYHLTCNHPAPPRLDTLRSWHVKQDLDIKAMQQGAAHLIGAHDFTSYRSSHCQAEHANRSIDQIDIHESYNPIRPGRHIYIDIRAISFLHHQVRNITGTLKDVGTGKLQPKDIKTILEAHDRTKAGMTAPAHGLYFTKVVY